MICGSVSRKFLRLIFVVCVTLIPNITISQSNNYWQRSFNEESSLLSGAVVGGGAGPSAIYYNPASISEIARSKFTLNASLFSFDFINLQNALGNGINLSSNRAVIQPRFISYMIKLKRYPNWSFELAFLNNENSKVDLVNSVDEQKDVLSHAPGAERYFALFRYTNNFRDDWLGLGGSVNLNQRLSAGMGLFVTIKSDEYTNLLSIEAVSNYTARYQEYVYLKYNDYRLLFKGGLMYKSQSVSLGLAFTSPSFSVYSDGKRVTRSEQRDNISDTDTGDPLPDYVVSDYKQKKEVKVNYKTPFSLAAGLTYRLPGERRTIYTSVEYFNGLKPFKLLEANVSPYLGEGFPVEGRVFSDWLSFAGGAKPVFNAAVGYSWQLNKKLHLMTGFRTDFNFQKNYDFQSYVDLQKQQVINLDLYHFTGGLAWKIFGQDIITGIEYNLGSNKNQKQIVNLSDPVEYNNTENLPLQGTRTQTMRTNLNSFNIYFGASFNFGGKAENVK